MTCISTVQPNVGCAHAQRCQRIEAHGAKRPKIRVGEIQPPRTETLDLTGDEDTIQARMNQGARRNIRKSIKQNVEIREGTRAEVASFNALLAETGDRADFGVHTPAYYELAYDLFVPHNRAALILGSYGGQDLAGVMVFALGDWSWYFYGASSDRERQRMASYGVQWAGIQWARARGAKVYDMYGVPDEDPETLEARFEQRNDDLWGVYRFKRGPSLELNGCCLSVAVGVTVIPVLLTTAMPDAPPLPAPDEVSES